MTAPMEVVGIKYPMRAGHVGGPRVEVVVGMRRSCRGTAGGSISRSARAWKLK